MSAPANYGTHDGGSGAAVSAVTAAAYTVPTDAPKADGTCAWDSTTIVVVHASAAGATGVGHTYGPARRSSGSSPSCSRRVSSEDPQGLRFVRERIAAEVAAGEYLTRLADAERMCASGAVDCLQADVTRCGGVTVWLRIAAMAAAHQIGFSGHCAPAISAAPAAAAPALRHLEWFHDHVRLESMLFDGTLDPHRGTIMPGEAPGNGLTVRTSDAEKFRVA